MTVVDSRVDRPTRCQRCTSSAASSSASTRRHAISGYSPLTTAMFCASTSTGGGSGGRRCPNTQRPTSAWAARNTAVAGRVRIEHGFDGGELPGYVRLLREQQDARRAVELRRDGGQQREELLRDLLAHAAPDSREELHEPGTSPRCDATPAISSRANSCGPAADVGHDLRRSGRSMPCVVSNVHSSRPSETASL